MTEFEASLSRLDAATEANLSPEERVTYSLMEAEGFARWEIMDRFDQARALSQLSELRRVRGD